MQIVSTVGSYINSNNILHFLIADVAFELVFLLLEAAETEITVHAVQVNDISGLLAPQARVRVYKNFL